MKALIFAALAGFSLVNCAYGTEPKDADLRYYSRDTIPPVNQTYTYPVDNATGVNTPDPQPQAVSGTEATVPQAAEEKAEHNDGRSDGNVGNHTVLDPNRGVGSGKDGQVTGERSPNDPGMRTSGNGGNGNINSASSGRDYKRATKSGGNE